MTTDLILGTAGHIDHGKTSLIKALTGVDTDRLPEERRRGITIELGFACLVLDDYRLGIVDVPGHERFVRNMLAGATGMDLAMLVVAADDSVKPQTREHLEILRLVDLDVGVIALTKCDLAEPDWVDLVEEEVRDLVAGTFLADAPIVRTSTATGEGLDRLRSTLAAGAKHVAESRRMVRLAGPFRMAIDRIFTVAGHGTVVTGSVASGRCEVGDELVIQPGDLQVRVRGLQNHDRGVESIHRGQRAAINLAGVHHESVRRGCELASPGHLVPTKLITARLTLLPSAPRPLRNRARVRAHVGTADIMSSVVLLDRDRLEPGDTAPVQLFLAEPAVMVWNQPLVARSESPVVTIGGGQVLDPNAEKIRKPSAATLEMIGDLSSDDPLARASASLFFMGLRAWQPRDLLRTAGLDDYDAACRSLLERGALVTIDVSPTRTIHLHRRVCDQLCARIEAALARLHEQKPLHTMVDVSRLASRLAYLESDGLVNTLLDVMRGAGRLKQSKRGVALTSHAPKLSVGEKKLLEQLIQQYRGAGLQPPSVQDCQQRATKLQDAVPQLIALAADEGELVQISPEFYLHTNAERDLRETLGAEMAGSDGLTLSQIREILKTTRKYAIPFCEYLDQIGFTHRRGDVRVLAAASTA